MEEHLHDPEAEEPDAPSASEDADPPRPVRGLRWVVLPTLAGVAVGAAWSAYYAAVQRVDPMTPVLVGGAVGLGIGAFLWAFFPYKGGRRRTNSAERGPS